MLTWEVIIWFSVLLRHVELVVFDVVFTEEPCIANFAEMFVKPIYGSYHEISAVKVLLDLYLQK